jgi:hypothetical protein
MTPKTNEDEEWSSVHKVYIENQRLLTTFSQKRAYYQTNSHWNERDLDTCRNETTWLMGDFVFFWVRHSRRTPRWIGDLLESSQKVCEWRQITLKRLVFVCGLSRKFIKAIWDVIDNLSYEPTIIEPKTYKQRHKYFNIISPKFYLTMHSHSKPMCGS